MGATAKDRIVTPDAIAGTRPEVILASWCGKKVVPARIRSRPGWDRIPAVAANRIFEIKSPLILQPGPALHCRRFVRRTAVQTAVPPVTTGIILALLTGIAVKLKVFGPGP